MSLTKFEISMTEAYTELSNYVTALEEKIKELETALASKPSTGELFDAAIHKRKNMRPMSETQRQTVLDYYQSIVKAGKGTLTECISKLRADTGLMVSDSEIMAAIYGKYDVRLYAHSL